MLRRANKGQMQIPSEILALLILAIVLVATFIIANNFSGAVLDLKERMGWLGELPKLVPR